jgi:hypothetical protein
LPWTVIYRSPQITGIKNPRDRIWHLISVCDSFKGKTMALGKERRLEE